MKEKTSLSDLFNINTNNPQLYSNSDSSQNVTVELSNICPKEFSDCYYFLCKNCNEVPKATFLKKDKIKFICEKCQFTKILKFNEVYNYLLFSENNETSKLKCRIHIDEKYIYYCEEHKENYCRICVRDCNNHKNKLKDLSSDENIYDKYNFINNRIKKIKEEKEMKNNRDDETETDNFLDNNNVLKERSYKILLINEKIKKKNDINNINNIQNDDKSDEDEDDDEENRCIIKEKTNSNNISINENNPEFNSFINEDNEDKKNDPLTLFSIIIRDYGDYPNYNHLETITSIENYIVLFYSEYQEINLKYLLNEEVNGGVVDLFGNYFIINNKNKSCFLVINDEIVELIKTINLLDYFDSIEYPFTLNVKLIESKQRPINNMSYMFEEINNLQSNSDFSQFKTDNINDMSYMFIKCSLLIELPDISIFDTSNVINMAYMFYNCSSLIRLPDINKWNTRELRYINEMFCNCESLTSINISDWNVGKLQNINYLFRNCKSLTSESIPRWEINYNTSTLGVF